MTVRRALAVAYLTGLAIAATGLGYLWLTTLLPGGPGAQATVAGLGVSAWSAFLMRRPSGQLQWQPRPSSLIGLALFGLAIYAWMLPRMDDGSMRWWAWVMVLLIWAVPVYLLVVATRLVLAEGQSVRADGREAAAIPAPDPLTAYRDSAPSEAAHRETR